MKICLLEMQPTPYTIGGGTTHILKLSNYLIKKGHEVCLISSKPGNNQKMLSVSKGLKVYSVGIPHKIFKKTNIFSIFYNLVYRFLFEIIWIFSAIKVLKRINPDICNPQSLITTALPCSLTNTPFIATLHGAHLHGFRRLWRERRVSIIILLSKIYEKLESFNFKKAEGITCVGQDCYDYYSRFGKEKCSIITHGIDLDEFKNVNFSKKEKRYLFLSRLSEQKGISYLIDALEILDKKGIKLNIVIAGDGDKGYVKKLKDRTLKFKNIKPEFPGFVIGKKKIDLYKSSAVFILPSIFEPFGIVLVEAMASGNAIIASDCEGPRLIIKKEFGKIIPYDDEKARAENLAKAIQESLRWDTKRMGKSAIKEARKYSYDKLADSYLRVFNRVLIKQRKRN